jgi:2-dehydro-3-deoxyphosphogalactonate aldolase
MSVPFPSLNRGIVAILRGLRPEEAVEIGSVIYEAGIEAIEVPLNSPEPFRSIEALVGSLPAEALIGGGTVLRAEDVDRLNDVGGRLLVSPNIEAEVMVRAAELGLVTLPGVFTPTEAFEALRLGASALKFFPASVLGPSGIAAMKAVLPKDALVGVVGGVSDLDFAAYAKVGVRTFGLGSSLFKPGMSVDAVRERAIAAADAWDRVFAGSGV